MNYISTEKKNIIGSKEENICVDNLAWIEIIDNWWESAFEYKDYMLGVLFYHISEFNLAEKYTIKFIKSSRHNNKIKLSGYVNLITILNNLGKQNKAIQFAEKAIFMSHELGEHSALATTHLNLGELYLFKGDHSKSIISLNKAKNLLTEFLNFKKVGTDDILGKMARTKAMLGSCYQNIQNDSLADKYFSEAIELSNLTGELYTKIIVYRGLCFIQAKKGNLQESKRFAKLAQELSLKLGIKHHIASTYLDLGNLYNQFGDYDKSYEYYNDAKNIFIKVDNKLGYYLSLANIALIYHFKNRLLKAEHGYLESLPYLDGDLKATFLSNYASLCNTLGKYKKSIELLNEAISISHSTKNNRSLRTAYLNIGNTYLSLENDTQAKLSFMKSLDIAIEINDTLGEARSLVNLGIAEYNLGHSVNGEQHVNNGYLILKNTLGDMHSETVEAKSVLKSLQT